MLYKFVRVRASKNFSTMVTWVGEACGIGLALQRRDAGVYIHEVIEGGAASRCPDEILIGDQLLQVPWSKATFPSLFSLPNNNYHAPMG